MFRIMFCLGSFALHYTPLKCHRVLYIVSSVLVARLSACECSATGQGSSLKKHLSRRVHSHADSRYDRRDDVPHSSHKVNVRIVCVMFHWFDYCLS